MFLDVQVISLRKGNREENIFDILEESNCSFVRSLGIYFFVCLFSFVIYVREVK